MNVRTKIQVVLLLAIGLAAGVAVLVPLDRRRMDELTDALVERGVAALDLDARMRVAVLYARRAEDRILAADDPTFATDVLAHVGRLTELAAAGERLAAPEARQRYAALGEHARRYAEAVAGLARVLAQGKESLSTWRSRVVADSDGVLGFLERLEAELRARPGGTAAPAGRAAQDLLTRIMLRVQELRRLGEAVAERRGASGRYLPQDAIARHRAVVEELIAALAEETRGVDERAALASARYEFASLTDALTDLEERVGSLLAATAEHEAAAEEAADQLWAEAERLHLFNRSAIQALRRRAKADARAGELRILLFMALGTCALIVFGLAVTRSVTRRIATVTGAAQRVVSGEVGTTIPSDADDELAELAHSFNRMSERVRAQQERQRGMNRIVTALNVAVGTRELFTRSIGEVARVAGADVALAYLTSDDGRSVRLVATYALAPGAVPAQIAKLGEGVIGAVAAERRARRVRGVGAEALGIATGGGVHEPGEVLVMPMVLADELQGVIELAKAGEFPADLTPFLDEVLAQVAVAAGTARTWEALQRTAQELSRRTAELQDKTQELEEQGRSLRQVNEELARASDLKSEFLANVSHELRTPLNSIMGFTELVLDKTEGLPARRRKNLESVMRNARSLTDLIDDLLDLSKIEAGRVTITPERFAPGELIEECLRVVRPLADQKGIELVGAAADDLPELHTDRGKLRQILLNLLSNAVKFTDRGQVRIGSLQLDGGDVQLDVTDTGIGISPDDLSRVFDKFHQVDGTSSRRVGGTGLGLTISRDLAVALGGSLTVESALGNGSTFRVRIPLVYRGHAAAGPSGEGIPTVRARRRSLLVVDDDPRLVILLREALQPAGVEVRSAFTSQEGLAILRRLQARAVVFDPWRPSKPGAALADGLPAVDRAGDVLAIGLSLSKDGALALMHTVAGDGGGGAWRGPLGELPGPPTDDDVERAVVQAGRPRDEVLADLRRMLEGAR